MLLKLLYKNDFYIDNEFNLMCLYVYKSLCLLEYLDQWDMVCKIVMQYYEWVDGFGYLLGLKEDDICDGVKLLVILDIFDVMMYFCVCVDKQVIFKKKVVIEFN